jgi:hypothetical protein
MTSYGDNSTSTSGIEGNSNVKYSFLTKTNTKIAGTSTGSV